MPAQSLRTEPARVQPRRVPLNEGFTSRAGRAARAARAARRAGGRTAAGDRAAGGAARHHAALGAIAAQGAAAIRAVHLARVTRTRERAAGAVTRVLAVAALTGAGLASDVTFHVRAAARQGQEQRRRASQNDALQRHGFPPSMNSLQMVSESQPRGHKAPCMYYEGNTCRSPGTAACAAAVPSPLDRGARARGSGEGCSGDSLGRRTAPH
jgi:hypothetical protein